MLLAGERRLKAYSRVGGRSPASGSWEIRCLIRKNPDGPSYEETVLSCLHTISQEE